MSTGIKKEVDQENKKIEGRYDLNRDIDHVETNTDIE